MKTSDNYRPQSNCGSCEHVEYIDGVHICAIDNPVAPDHFIGFGGIQIELKRYVVHQDGVCDRYAGIPTTI
jgi:hypothetical protein